MALRISEDCINCGACEIECPVAAVYPRSLNPALKEPLFIDNFFYYSGFVSSKHYYINPYECTECVGLSMVPICNIVCPVSCCMTEKTYSDNITAKVPNTLVLINKFSLN